MTKSVTGGVAFTVALAVTATASALAGAWGVIKFQSDVLPGRILVSETEEFLAAVAEESR